MKRSVGFTIVELIVTITVMTILMTIIVVRLVFTERTARDQERSTDAITLSRGLEVYYQNGVTDLSIPRGYYPGVNQVQTAKATSPPFANFLEGVSKSSFEAPNRTINNSFGTDTTAPTGIVGANTDGSYSDSQATALLANYPYLYQPLRRDNTLCWNYVDCVKFNLYYFSETDNNSVRLIRSKNQ